MQNVEKKYILNLLVHLSDGFREYFSENGFEILKRSDVEEMAKLDYILVASNEEAIEASKQFAADKNDILIVCIGVNEDIQKFLIHEGRFSISENIFESEVGETLLNNFFKQEKSIHLEENFGDLFKKVESFSITNHMSAGESFDKACYHAFKSGFNLLSLRTYLDHSLFFLSYLKQAGEAEVPFVYEYSFSPEIFAVNIQVNIQDFFAEYLFDSFGSYGTNNPQKYILSVLAQTCNYLDICFIADSNKLVLTGLWDKSGTKSLKGVGFHQVETATKQIKNREKRNQSEYDIAKSFDSHKDLSAQKATDLPGGFLETTMDLEEDSILADNFDSILNTLIEEFHKRYPDDDITKVSEETLELLLPVDLQKSLTKNDKKILLENMRKADLKSLLSDKLEDAKQEFIEDSEFQETLINTSADTLAEEVSQKIKGNSLDDFLESTLVRGHKESDEESIVIGGESDISDDEKIEIKGGKDSAEEFKQTIKGLNEDDISELVQHFSSSLDEDETMQVISGGNNNIKAMTNSWVVKSLNNADTLKKSPVNLKAFLRDTAPKKLQERLRSYALELGKDFKDLSLEEIKEFRANKLPHIISDLINGEESVNNFAEKVSNAKSKSSSDLFDFEKMSKRDPSLNDFANEFKEKLVHKIKKLGSNIPKEELQQILKQTVKEKIATILEDDSLSKEQKDEHKNILVEQMAQTLGIPKSEVQAMLAAGAQKSNKAVEKLVQSKIAESGVTVNKTGRSAIDAQLSLKLKEIEAENQKLKDSLKALKLQSEAREDVNNTIAKINDEINELQENDEDSDLSNLALEQENSELMDKIENVEGLSELDKGKISKLLKDGKSQNSKAKREVRKLELEANQREVVFSQELERAQKVLKAKDFVIQKEKEAMRNRILKKDQELQGMKAQVHSLSQKIEGSESNTFEQDLKKVKSENENLMKSSELYKSKLDTLTKKLIESKNDTNNVQVAEENRTLKRIKANLERQTEGSLKQVKRIEERLQKVSSAELKLKIENSTLQSDLRNTQLQLRKLKEQSQAAVSNFKKQISSQSDQLVKDFEQAQSKNLELAKSLNLAESKVKELTNASKVESINQVDEQAVAQKYTTEIKRLNSELELTKSQSQRLQSKIDEISKATKVVEKDQSGPAKNAVDPIKQRLERSVKKLNSEMVKAQAETNEYKKNALKASKEVVGLKNQLMLLKKELEKAKKQNEVKAKKAA